MDEDEGKNPVLAVMRTTSPHEVSSPRGFCFGNRWFCSVECLEWGMGQEILHLFRKSNEQSVLLRPKIGRMLLLKKWITPEQLRDALEAQRQKGDKLGYWLVRLGYITEEKLITVLSEQLSVPWMDEIKQPFNQEAIAALPGMLCKKFNIFPLELSEDDQLTMAVDYGFTDEMISAVDEVVGVRVKPFLTRKEVLRQLIEEHEDSQSTSMADVIEDKLNFASQVGQRFVEKWFDLEAERARFGLFEGTLWIRYLKGEVASDYFMLFDDSATASLETEKSEASSGAL